MSASVMSVFSGNFKFENGTLTGFLKFINSFFSLSLLLISGWTLTPPTFVIFPTSALIIHATFITLDCEKSLIFLCQVTAHENQAHER